MGTGWGIGEGTGKGVKGGWRVSAFLLLLTGWQAVLLPWAPLILRDAGFSAASVGMLTGVSTVVGSVGVVVCLWGVRRSRSGAVRRLLLWLMLATAALLQGCGVGLALRHLSQGGAMPSCNSGWLFAPATPVLLLNNTSTPATPHLPKTVSSQQHSNLSPSATTKQPSPPPPPPSPSPPPPAGHHGAGAAANHHLQHSSSHRPAPANTTTTTTSTTTTPVTTTSTTTTTTIIPTLIPFVPVTHAKTTTTTTLPAATNPHTAPPSAVTTISIQPTFPAVKTTSKNSNGRVPLNNNKVTTVGTLTFGEDGATRAHHITPPGQGKHHAVHKPLIPARDGSPPKHYDKNAHTPDVSPKDSARGKHSGKTKYNTNHKNSGGPPKHYFNNAHPPDVPPKSSERSQNFGKTKYDLNHKNVQLSNDNDHLTSQDDSEDYDDMYLQDVDEYDNSEEDDGKEDVHYKDDHDYPQSGSRLRSFFSNLPQSAGNAPHKLPMTTARQPHRPSPRFKVSYDGKRQNRDYDLYQIGSRHRIPGRSRRDLTKTKARTHVHPGKVTRKKTKPQRDDQLENGKNSFEAVKSEIVKVGVAMLLVLGGLAGAGVEAGVAQLWHCFVHGYDESGVIHDVLHRTITHTFHLSAYGNHKTWSGITSGGWVVGAGVVSILACLAGTGGGGYGGLLGVHLALAIGALLLLLILPVPYGSIDPPRIRRPLSLYLDDEVLREGVRRLTFHIWVFINGCLTALSLTFSLWLLQEMTAEGWLVGSQASAVGMTLVCESLALHTQRRLVTRCGLHGLMGVCGVSLMLHYGIMWVSRSVGVVVVAHAGLGVAMAFLWVAVKHNALLLATVSDQEREAWASWWCWRLGVGVGAAMWGVWVSGAGGRVRPLLWVATVAAAILAFSLGVTAVLSRRNSRTRRRVYHTLDLDIPDDEVDDENDAAEDDWLVKRAKKEGLTL